MTPGQERAIKELRRLEAVAPDAFMIESEPTLSGNHIVAHLSLSIGPLKTAINGLSFRDREDFLLSVPPGYPFAVPKLRVTHDRFAGFPHVVWTHLICLYRSTIDWDPSDGLFGFFDRLQEWIGRAARNDMDPVDLPLEPPHHITDFSQQPFVIHANAPVAPGHDWFGLAHIIRHDERIDVIGWSDLSADPPKFGEAALAIMLAQPLPMEFPSSGKDFFDELEKQFVNRRMALSLLAFAANLTPEGAPIPLILGLPMRRAMDGSARQHIAVWTTNDTLADSLRKTVADKGDSQEMLEIRDDLAEAIGNVLAAGSISWCQVLENRPEIISRRDSESPLRELVGKRVLLLGCGGLGSWVAEFAARAGVSVLDVVDWAIVKPGHLIRQNYQIRDIGKNKAKALAIRLRQLAPDITCTAYPEEAYSLIFGDVDSVLSYDAVIDCTASSLFQMRLERDWCDLNARTPPVLSLGIDAKASRIIGVRIHDNSTGGPWDSFVRLKRHLTCAAMDQSTLEAFYGESAGSELVQPEPGCSDPTFVGSTADMTTLSGTALNAAVLDLFSSEGEAGFILPSKTGAQGHLSDAVVDLPPLRELRAGAYRIRIAPNVFSEARGWVQQNERLRSADCETGGLLWGLWDDAVNIIWVFDASGPPPDSDHAPSHFVCGVDGTKEEHVERIAASYGTVGFLGMWHTHPELSPQQSGTDIVNMARMVGQLGQRQRRALMMIFGREANQGSMCAFAYESESIDPEAELMTVGHGRLVLDDPVV